MQQDKERHLPQVGIAGNASQEKGGSLKENSKVEVDSSRDLDQGCKLSGSWGRQGMDTERHAGWGPGQPLLRCNSGLCRMWGLGSQRGDVPARGHSNYPIKVHTAAAIWSLSLGSFWLKMSRQRKKSLSWQEAGP